MAKERLTLAVTLKVPDNEAFSALEALRVKMGLGDRVRDLAREDVWEFEVTDGEAAMMTLERVVETTNLFANPNKHRYSLARGGVSDVKLADDEIAILVSDRESSEGESMVASLRRLGIDAIASTRRWVRWRVRLESAFDEFGRTEPDITGFIRSIAVADARDGGLFCNPHIESARAVLPTGEEKPLAR